MGEEQLIVLFSLLNSRVMTTAVLTGITSHNKKYTVHFIVNL